MQEQLRYLLKNGWTLTGINTVTSPDDQVTLPIERAYLAWTTKIKAQRLIEKHRAAASPFWRQRFLKKLLDRKAVLE